MTTELGTPEYVAPEVWKGEEFRYEPDIFALGIIFYEILLTKKPFPQNGTMEELAQTIINDEFDPTPLQNLIYAPVVDLVIKMLIKDKKERIQIDELKSINIYIIYILYIYIHYR